jgi:nucleotide-binding universal stress UspA family protein
LAALSFVMAEAGIFDYPLATKDKTMVAFKKILFPTEFSTSEKPALSHAIHLAELHHGEVLVQHVVNDDFERFAHAVMTTDVGEIQQHTDIAAENDMKEFLAPHSGLAGTVSMRPVLSKDKAIPEICALAEKEDVDLIVMGSTKGTITGKVIRMTPRPVLAFPSVPRPDGAEVFRVPKMLVATDFSDHSRGVVRQAFELRDVFDASIHLLYVIETSHAIEFAVGHGQFAHTIEKMKEWALLQLQD